MTDMGAFNIPLLRFPTSLFLGMALWWSHPELPVPHSTYLLALGSCAAAWSLLPALLGGRERWRFIEWLALGLMALTALFVCRPAFLSEIMARLPLLKSMHWPFRELLQFQFFAHLFLLLRRPGYSPATQWRLAAYGAAVFALPLFTYSLPPTFNAMNWDRRLILSGKDQVYWEHVRPLLQPGDRVAVLIALPLYDSDRFDVPYSLLGTYNYACIDGIINVSGYSLTPPQSQLYSRQGRYPFGAFFPDQRAVLLREHPDLKFITLEGLQPVKITLNSAAGPTVDLTPFIPHELDAKPHTPPGELGEKGEK